MMAKFMTKDIEENEVSTQLKSELTHPDKGNGIVILNRSDYIKSMTELVSDKKKF